MPATNTIKPQLNWEVPFYVLREEWLGRYCNFYKQILYIKRKVEWNEYIEGMKPTKEKKGIGQLGFSWIELSSWSMTLEKEFSLLYFFTDVRCSKVTKTSVLKENKYNSLKASENSPGILMFKTNCRQREHEEHTFYGINFEHMTPIVHWFFLNDS